MSLTETPAPLVTPRTVTPQMSRLFPLPSSKGHLLFGRAKRRAEKDAPAVRSNVDMPRIGRLGRRAGRGRTGGGRLSGRPLLGILRSTGPSLPGGLPGHPATRLPDPPDRCPAHPPVRPARPRRGPADLRPTDDATAAKLGIKRIETKAGRRGDENGYYTWPRYGFHGHLPRWLRNRLPASLDGADDVLDLMQSEPGRLWWREHGVALSVVFNLRHRSRSRQTFRRYLAWRRGVGS